MMSPESLSLILPRSGIDDLNSESHNVYFGPQPSGIIQSVTTERIPTVPLSIGVGARDSTGNFLTKTKYPAVPIITRPTTTKIITTCENPFWFIFFRLVIKNFLSPKRNRQFVFVPKIEYKLVAER